MEDNHIRERSMGPLTLETVAPVYNFTFDKAAMVFPNTYMVVCNFM